MSGIRIIGMGKAVPSVILANRDLERMVDTSDEWITARTGIHRRHICGPGESVSTLAAEAGRRALERAGITPGQVGLIIAATVNPDYQVPSLACVVQETLGIPGGIPAFDLNAACTGFIYAMQIANAMIQAGCACTGDRPCALLIGAEQLSRMLNYRDRSTCVLFGDGAAAAVAVNVPDAVFFSHTAASGDRRKLAASTIAPNDSHEDYPAARYAGNCRKAVSGPDSMPKAESEASERDASSPSPWLCMDGPGVFRFAVKALSGEITEMERRSGMPCEDIDYIVCHQANARIIEHVRRARKLPEEKFFMNLGEYGNTSGASIPLALAEMMEQGLLTPGKRIFCVGFGAGLTWGSVCLTF